LVLFSGYVTEVHRRPYFCTAFEYHLHICVQITHRWPCPPVAEIYN
jgi:hypothetical protein